MAKFSLNVVNSVRYVIVSRFRLIAKSLAAFIAAQMPGDASLRLSADAAGALSSSCTAVTAGAGAGCGPSQQARQTAAHLDSLRTNKQYASLRHTVDMAIESVMSPQMSLRDANMLLSRLVAALFPNVSYLEIIRRPSLWTG